MPGRWSVLDLVEAFQLAHAVRALHELRVLEKLREPATPKELSAELGLDPILLEGTLEYVAARTELVRRRGQRFVALRKDSSSTAFLLDLYAGAYAGNAAKLVEILATPSLAPRRVDGFRYARAFFGLDGAAPALLTELVERLELQRVLDLGCGTASLLLELARRNPEFAGSGVEHNPYMLKAARARIRRAGLGGRVRVFRGSGDDLRGVLSLERLAEVGAVTASNFVNELFAEGHRRAVVWLRGLKKLLPGRPLLIADYYGRLGTRTRGASRETLLHDYVQLISGQGVPPRSAAEWRQIHARAGTRLVHAFEDRATTRFVHLAML